MKVRKINLNKFLEENEPELQAFEKGLVVFEGEMGFLISDSEFVHYTRDMITDSIRIYANPKTDNPNSFYVMPNSYVCEQLSALEKYMEEIDICTFFRSPNYNTRLGQNFASFCDSLRKIEFDGVDEIAPLLKERNIDK